MLGLCFFQGLSYLCLGGKLHVNISRTGDVAALLFDANDMAAKPPLP